YPLHSSPSCIFTLSLHDALPIYFLGFYNDTREDLLLKFCDLARRCLGNVKFQVVFLPKNMDCLAEYERRGIECLTELVPFEEYRSEEHTSELQSRENLVCRLLLE